MHNNASQMRSGWANQVWRCNEAAGMAPWGGARDVEGNSMQLAVRELDVAVAGAGSIGCYVGGCMALAGHRVRLLARPSLVQSISAHGLAVSGLSGFKAHVAAGEMLATA